MLGEQPENEFSTVSPGVPDGPGGGVFPLTGLQQDIWTAEARCPGTAQFTLSVRDHVTGDVDDELLVGCLERALARNDHLRQRFGERDGVAYRTVVDLPADPVHRVDLRGEPDPASAVRHWFDGFDAHAYDPVAGVPVDVAVVRRSDDDVWVAVRAHHLVSDAWGLHLFLEQVRAEQAALLRGERPGGGPGGGAHEPRPVAETVADDAAYRASARFAADLEAMRASLDGVRPALFDRAPRAGRPAPRYAGFSVDRAVTDRIRERGESVSTVLTGAVAIYLGRLLRSDDVVVGVPLSNRPDGRTRATVGQFANTLPLPVHCPADTTVGELLAAIRSGNRNLLRHQRVPLGDVVRARRADGADASAGPPFDVTVAYLRWPTGSPLPGATYRTSARTHAHELDTIAMWVTEFDRDSPVEVTFEYAPDVFDDDLPPDGIARHLSRLVDELAGADADTPLGTVDMLSAAERDGLLHGHNDTDVAFREDATLSGLFREQAARTPERVALTGPDGTSVTYAELDRRSARIAQRLVESGVRPGDRVAVLCGRDPALLAALFGVLRTGAAYVPLDPAHPSARIAAVLAASDPRLVLTGPGASVPRAWSGRSVPVVPLQDGPAPSSAPDRAEPDGVAYVIHTSGSSGVPKGVMVEHRSVVNRLSWMQRAYPLGPDDVLLQKTPVTFDVSVWELFWWSLAGARLVLAPDGAERDPRATAAVVRDEGVTVLHFVPSVLGPFAEHLRTAGSGTGALRRVFASGEALVPALVRRFQDATGGAVALTNLYGPTEATVDVSFWDCPPSPDRVPIGSPIDNIALDVLDPAGNPQPIGAPGELVVSGVGVARGYLGDPQRTAEVFGVDLFRSGRRTYRTGDVARRLADGTLEYLGRADDQVKIRGVRVEPGEVAARLREIGGFDDVAVVARRTPGRHARLVAYHVGGDGADAETLRARMADVLPPAFVPSWFVAVAAIPLTSSGKLDRARLPEPPDPAAGAAGRALTDAERDVADVLSDVLEVAAPGPDDTFFGLGGDSITALRVRTSAERRGLRIDVADLVANPTIAELAARAQPVGTEPDDGPVAPFALLANVDRPSLTGVADAFPAGHLALGMLYHTESAGTGPDGLADSAVYRDAFRYTLRMPWDPVALTAGVRLLIARHPALRSSFSIGNRSEPLQVVHHTVPLPLQIADLRAVTPEQAERDVAETVRRRRFHPWAPDEAPLWGLHACARIDADGAETVDLVLSFHHAVLDGWSAGSLMAELLDRYARRTAGLPEPDPEPLRVTPADHARDERAARDRPESPAFWRDELAGARPAAPESFAAAEPRREPGAHSRTAPLPEDLTARLRALSRARGVPERAILFAAYRLAIGVYCPGPEDPVLGLVSHTRPERADGDRVAGLFLNTVPVRIRADGPTWFAVAQEVVRSERANHPHRRVPMGSLVESGVLERLDVAFNYVDLHVLDPVVRRDGVRLLRVQPNEETNFALLSNAIVDPTDGRLYLRHDTDGTYPPAQLELIADTMLRFLERLVDHPDEPVTASVPDVSVTRRDPSKPLVDVVTLIRAQAARTPHAPALCHDDRVWTFAETDRRCAAMAAALRERAEPGARVGIALERSPEMIAVLLAVLRAGMCAVPLDLSYPRGRIEIMLEIAEPAVVVAGSADAGPFGDAVVLTPSDLDGPVPESDLPAPGLEDVACLLFTSGSTGRPKGVELPHRLWAYYARWQAGTRSGLPGETLQFAPLSFDMSFQETFSALPVGGALRTTTEDVRRDPYALLRLLDRYRVRRLLVPFVALQQMAEASAELGLVPDSLVTIISGAEQMRITPEIRALCAAVPGMRLENQYGPTETHEITFQPLDGDPDAYPDLPPVGEPMDGVEILILDDDGDPVPIGVTGQIHVAGDCLALGYRGRPDLTDAAFVPHRFRDGERMYRTGDLGRMTPDGRVVWLGRADRQVKVRGFRIEPAEVELAVLNSTPGRAGVGAAAVVAHRRDGGDAVLVGYLIGDAGAVDTEALTAELRAELPAQMVPSHLVWIDEFPLTPSGKRDDAALAARPIERSTGPTGPDLPRDELEATVAGVLAEMLGMDRIGVHDDFFTAGGTSLTAMRMLTVLQRRFGVRVPLSALAAHPTAAGLAGQLRDVPGSDAVDGAPGAAFDPLVPLRTGGGRTPLFLVHPLGGHVLCYARLARLLGEDRPVYGLQASGTEPGTEPYADMTAMARRYLRAVREVQPHGPYVVGGWSFGGFAAFEMARLLREQGETVERVLLLDTITMQSRARDAVVSEADVLEFFAQELLWFEWGRSPSDDEPVTSGGSVDEELARIAERAVHSGVLPSGTSATTVRRLFDVFRAHWRAMLEYAPGEVDLDLVLVRAQDTLPAVLRPMHDAVGTLHTDPARGWDRFTRGRLDVLPMPGDHLTMLEPPHVEGLAQRLDELLSAVPTSTGEGRTR